MKKTSIEINKFSDLTEMLTDVEITFAQEISNTPSHIIAEYAYLCDKGTIHQLLANGDDLKHKNLYDETAAVVAAKNFPFEAFNYLVTDQDRRDLACIICVGTEEEALGAINKAETLNILDLKYNTLLHYAVRRRSIQMVKALFTKGIEPNNFNINLETPLDIAEQILDAEQQLRESDKDSNSNEKHIKAIREIIDFLHDAGALTYEALFGVNITSQLLYWLPKPNHKISIRFCFTGIAEKSCNKYGFNVATTSVTKSQKALLLRVFHYISSVFDIDFNETKNSKHIDLYIGQILDKYSEENTVEIKTKSKLSQILDKVSVGINGININDSKIKHYPNFCFAYLLQNIVISLGFSLGYPRTKSAINSVTILPREILRDEEHYTTFSEFDKLVLSSRYPLKWSNKSLKAGKEFDLSDLVPIGEDVLNIVHAVENRAPLAESYTNIDSSEIEKILSEGSESEIETLLAKGFDVNKRFLTKHYTYKYPLAEAILYNNIRVIKVLIEAGAKVNLMRSNSYNVLTDACSISNLSVVKMLLDAGADPNLYTCNKYSSTALIEAAKKNELEIIKLLLVNGAELNAKDYYGHTAVQKACINNSFEAAQFLYEQGAEIDLLSALSLGLKEKAEEFIQSCKYDNREKQRVLSDLLLNAVSENNFCLTKAILELGVIVEDHVFINAVDKRDHNLKSINIIEFLLDHGANLYAKDIHGNSALHIAASTCVSSALMRLLLERGINPSIKNDNGYSALHLIITNSPKYAENSKKILLLINSGADLQEKDKQGNNVFHLIAQRPIMLAHHRLFFMKGIDINEKNNRNENMLDIAIVNRLDQVFVEIFKYHGGILDSKDCYLNYIEVAIELDVQYMIPNLLIAGAKPNLLALLMLKMYDEAINYIKGLSDFSEINESDLEENTPLHYAAKCGNLELAILLIEKGANVNAVNKNNETVIDLAKKEENRTLILDYNLGLIKYLTYLGSGYRKNTIDAARMTTQSITLEKHYIANNNTMH